MYKYVVSKRHKCNSSKIRLASLIFIFLFLLPPSSSFLLHAFHRFPTHKQTLYQLLGHPFLRFLFFPSAPQTASILTLPTSHRYNFSFFSSFFLLSHSVAPPYPSATVFDVFTRLPHRILNLAREDQVTYKTCSLSQLSLKSSHLHPPCMEHISTSSLVCVDT